MKEKIINALKIAYTKSKNWIIEFSKKTWKSIKDFPSTKSGQSFQNSLIAIGVGLLVGFLVMFITKPARSIDGFGRLLSGGFSLGLQSVGTFLQDSTPIIMTGLAFAFASKTGLFNIGGSGQFMIGGVAALYVANLVTLPAGIHFIACVLAAVIAGAIWASIAGLLKAFFNVSEVISTIMLNYIGMYLMVILVLNPAVYDENITAINLLHPTANTPHWGLNKIFTGSNLDIGIIIVILMAILIWFVLNKTTLGYQLKAVGYSNTGSQAAGIPYKRNVVTAMSISGALAGLGAALAYLPTKPVYMRPITSLVSYGFDGMSVALLANNNPIGIIFSGIFVSYIKTAAKPMQLAGYDKEIGNIVIAVIIYMAAFSSFFGMLIKKRKEKKKLLSKLETTEEVVNE
ncbi:MAG: ABC transporter permease [Bacilli bacterium]|nr:ABC transporter permease [Bacilli bacterium]